MVSSWRTALVALLAASCGVEPPGATGGTDEPMGPCGRGVIVTGSDDGRQSSNVSLVAWDGRVLTESLLSSASRVEKLSVPLGGDVGVPTQAMLGARIAVLDRVPSGVITWIDVRSGRVASQLAVGTGFAANPHDYLELGPNKAYVPRFDVNGDPGRQAWDGGGDVLVVDPSAREIIGRIDLRETLKGEDPTLLARGDRAVAVGDRVIVVVQAISRDYARSAPDRLVVVDSGSDTVTGVHPVGMTGCSGVALEPTGLRLALSCTGAFDGDAEPSLGTGGIVVFDVAGAITEVARLPAKDYLGAPPGFGIDWATDDSLMITTLGSLSAGRPDTVRVLDVPTGRVRTLSEPSAYSVEGVACAARCGACFTSDAEKNALAQWDVASGVPALRGHVVVERRFGFGPRQIGTF